MSYTKEAAVCGLGADLPPQDQPCGPVILTSSPQENEKAVTYKTHSPTAPVRFCSHNHRHLHQGQAEPLLGDEDKKAPPSTLILCLLVLLHLT